MTRALQQGTFFTRRRFLGVFTPLCVFAKKASTYSRSVDCATNTLNVLLVEDTEDDAFFFRLTLKRTGVPCLLTHVEDGGKAIDYLGEVRLGKPGTPVPDFIFLDLKMPGLNGFDVLEWIVEQRFDPPLKIAVLSGSDHEVDINQARSLGVSDYIVKPISVEELEKRLKMLARSAGEDREVSVNES
jgi:DNA-binding response OmpR family regulator